jgi:pilus assembly protein CpaC
MGLAVFVLLRPEPGFADEDNTEDRIIVVNMREVIDLPYVVDRVIRGSEDIDVTPINDRQLVVRGRRAGRTNLLLYDRSGTLRDEIVIVVVPRNLQTVMGTVKELLDDIEGLDFRIINERIYILGVVALDEEYQRVKDLSDAERLVEHQVSLSPLSQRLLAGVIEEDIGVASVNARLINGQIILEGIVHSEAASLRAMAIAQAYYDEVTNVLEVRQVRRIPGHTKTVTVLVHFVQLSKSLTTTWGISWQPVINNGIDVFFQRDYLGGWSDSSIGSATASVSLLLPRLERARASGYARVLENPTIAVKSGEEALIFSGFEYPYLVTTGLVTTVEWKDVGISLGVTPYAQGNDVDMDLDITVSDLGEVAPNGFQAVDRVQLMTSQYCRAGESIVVGGLQRVLSKVSYNRVPSTDQTGAIFNLYANRDYKKSKSQFLVFLTPQVHESSSSANRAIKDAFNLQEVRQ